MSTPTKTRQWILSSKATGLPTFTGPNPNFTIQETTLPPLGPDQVLVKTLYLSNDPGQRGWIQAGQKPDRIYMPLVEEGEVMRGGSISEVLESNSADLQKGQLVFTFIGWTEYAIADAKDCRPIEVDEKAGIRATTHLGALSFTGMTAYYGLVDVVRTKAEDSVVVSGAAGATGSMVVQIAKHLVGCKKVIGIAGGEKKCRWVESLGADVCIDYKSPSFKDDLIKATEGYVDVYFDNVGGEILDLMLTRLKLHGRVAACGAIANYNKQGQPEITNWNEIIFNRLEIRGLITLDAFAGGREKQIIAELVKGAKEGKINIGEDSEMVVPTKFEDIPKTWLMLFQGGNQGKLVTQLV